MISSYLPILIGNWKTGSLKNSVDPDEMFQNEAFISVSSDPINTDWSLTYSQVNVYIGNTLSWLNGG